MSAIASVRTVLSLLVAGAVTFLPAAVPAQARSKPAIMVVSNARTDRPGEVGRREVDSAAQFMEAVFAIELARRFPCAKVMRLADDTAQAQWQKVKDLLGVDDEQTIAEVAGGQGVRYVVLLDVEHAGDMLSVSAEMLDFRSKAPRQESSLSGPANDLDRFDPFAASFANGAPGPDCGRIGTVLLQTKIDDRGRTPGGASYGSSQTTLLSCTFQLDTGLSGDGTCNYADISILQGSGYTQERRTAANEASARAGFTFVDGNLRFSISGFVAKLTMSGLGGNIESEVMVGPFPFDIPTNATAGSWSNGAGSTVEWNLPDK
ncbi:MAG: hypothetical protein FIB01_04615 [Gemmatimonadetes bacterium]|nr:hypothetical protein [Gemmatimonadota bacterium]